MPSTSLSIACGWSPAGGKSWCEPERDCSGKVTTRSGYESHVHEISNGEPHHFESANRTRRVHFATASPLPRSSRRRDGARATRSSASPKPSSPTPNPKRSTSASASTTTTTASCRCSSACAHAESERLKSAPQPRGYLPIDGIAAYDKAVQALVFGADSAQQDKRIVTVQALGGTGGLRSAPTSCKRINPDAEVWISDPSWENHRALFEAAGFKVNTYPYYDAEDARPRLRRHAARARARCRPARSSCCTPAATTRPAST